jgi:hypothetical protein
VRAAGFERIQQRGGDQQGRADHRPDDPPLTAFGDIGETTQVLGADVRTRLALGRLTQPGVQQSRQLRRLFQDLGQTIAEAVAQFVQAVTLAHQVGEHRLRHGPDVELRMQQATDPFDVQQRLLQQQQLRLDGQLVASARA